MTWLLTDQLVSESDLSVSSSQKASGVATKVASAGLLVGATYVLSRRQTAAAEARFPPVGRFLNVDGVRLHYVDQGNGPPIVLFHGQGALLQDWTQTILPRLSRTHRVIAFDRPGSGYSSRPSGTRWTAERQAQLFRSALVQLGVHRPIVVGHSYGALVAMAYAQAHPGNTAGLVLLSGFFYPVGRILLKLASFAAGSIVGPLLCNTVLPPLFKLTEPLNWRAHFAPHRTPEATENYPFALTARPNHIRSFAIESGQIESSARRISGVYRDVCVPAALIAGKRDHVVSHEEHSMRLHRELSNSTIALLENCGHMPHFTHPEAVLQAVGEVVSRSSASRPPEPKPL